VKTKVCNGTRCSLERAQRLHAAKKVLLAVERFVFEAVLGGSLSSTGLKKTKERNSLKCRRGRPARGGGVMLEKENLLLKGLDQAVGSRHLLRELRRETRRRKRYTEGHCDSL